MTMKTKKFLFFFILIACIAVIYLPRSDAHKFAPPVFSSDKLTVKTLSGDLPFTIELAETPAQQEYGLMFRTHLAADHGMLFIMPKEYIITMWMKNTVLPLDMLFIDNHGSIVSIAANATPYSEAVISAGAPARAGGTAAADHIAVGDTIAYKAFRP
jgi:uncharacterized membrane protein (UPF0127 family)